jgi:AcrR family transcriptional regulator
MASLLSLSLDTNVVLPLEVYQMGRPPADQEQIHAFRIMAIEAAWRVFERGGEQAVTTRAVAAELGCSPMTAYRYFENHEALVNYLRAEAFQRFASFLRSKGEKEPDLCKRIDAVSRAYVGYGIKNMETYKLMFNHSAAVSPGPSMNALLSASKLTFSTIHDIYKSAIATGLITGEPLVEAHRQWIRVHGIVTLAIANKLIFGLSIEDIIDLEFGTAGDE